MAVRLCAILAIIFSIWLFLPVTPQKVAAQAIQTPDSDVQTLVYEVYAGGINAVQAKLDLVYGDGQDRYSAVLVAYTQGFLGKLAPWQGSFETHGWRMTEEDKPELHKSVSVWRDEEEVKEYSYGKDGSFKGLSIVEEGVDKSPAALDESLVQGTTDALTATLQMMKAVAAGGRCEGESEVFDGERRFRLVFKHDEMEKLNQTRYNVYAGETARCQVEVVPMSGKWHSKPRGWMSIQEQGREKGSLPTVWVASIDEGVPAVPVKIRVKTDYGTLFMHLVEYRNGDTVITTDDS